MSNAHSVRLASQDGRYGIKVKSSNQAVVSYGTSVDNPITGVYEYSFDPPTDTVYIVSWGVVPSAGDDETYIVQEVGPFNSSFNLQAQTTSRGTFVQGTIGSLTLTATEFDGTPIDPDTITYSITSEDGVTVYQTGVPEKVKTGIYVFEWDIPTTQPAGKYLANWVYTMDDLEYAEVQRFVVAEDVTDTVFYSGNLLLMRQSLEILITGAQNVPVYFQQARPSADSKHYYWNRGNWNQKRGTTVYRNKKLITDGYQIDYAKGSVIFDSQLTNHDIVHADFNLKWFTDEELDMFLNNGFSVVNMYPPHTTLGVMTIASDANFKYWAPVLYAAAIDAIRSLMFQINWLEPAQYFGMTGEGGTGTGRDGQVYGQLEGLKKNYEDLLIKLLEQKKFFPYSGLTKMVVVPEYTLPGGRSRWFRYLFSGSGMTG